MSLLKNNRLLRAINKEPLDCTPIWIMRQAGRYLPEYRAVRERAGSFMNLCKTPKLAAEVTLQPIQRYPLDAAILFSDILTIPDALGLGLRFVEGEGPQFAQAMRTSADIEQLPILDLGRLEYVYETIHLVKQALSNELPLIGFCGSPWTVAAYMIEGKASKGFDHAKTMMREDPALLHRLLSILEQSIALHLAQQIEAGVDVVMLFDTFGGLLAFEEYQDFSLAYLSNIIAFLRARYNKRIPIILFTKCATTSYFDAIVQSGCDVVGVDWTVSLNTVREQIGEKVALQGNLPPDVLLQSEAHIQQAVSDVLADYVKGSGHIFNLGHGITPDVPPEHVRILVDAVHKLSVPYHANET